MRNPEALQALRQIVVGDVSLIDKLRPINDWDAFVQAIVSEGAAHGLEFEAADVEEALRAGQQTWLVHWTPVL
jgi:hypothetical protein